MKKKTFKMKTACLVFFMTALQTVVSAQHNFFWSTQGNKSTNPSVNYLGTKDNKDLVFRTNALQRMCIKANGNIGIGISNPAQKLDVGGNINIGTGYGLYLGGLRYLSTPGSQNLYFGYYAGENSAGFENLFIGNYSGQNGGGFHNTIIGYQAGMKNSGANNTFCGHQSGVANTSGTYNTFYGLATGYSNTTGDGNSLFGQNVMWTNVSGSWNCSFGFEAGNFTTTSYNCFYGAQAGLANMTGSRNTYVGYSANANGPGYSNSSCFGYTSQLTASNQVRLGNSAVTSIGGYAGWTNISDGRFKSNIKDNVPGLEFIKQLHPVTYTLNLTGIDAFIHKGQVMDMSGKKYEPSDQTVAAMKEKERIVYTGFVAQEVEAVAKKLRYDFSGVDAPKNDKDLYGLRYAEFVVPLVKAVQELSKMNDDKDILIAKQQQQLDDLSKRLAALEKNAGISSNDQLSVAGANIKAARLEQNAPNPFLNETYIQYYIPVEVKQARLVITDMHNRQLKVQTVNAGYGKLTIQAGSLAAGTYIYALYGDGKLIDSKKMILLNNRHQ